MDIGYGGTTHGSDHGLQLKGRGAALGNARLGQADLLHKVQLDVLAQIHLARVQL